MDAFLFRTGAHDLSGARIAGLEHHAWNTMLASVAYLSTAVQRIRSSHSFCREIVNVYVKAEKTCPGWCLGTKGI